MKIFFLLLTFFLSKGLFCVYPFFYTPYNSDLKTSYVSSMDIDSDGRIWIASDKGLIFNYFYNFRTVDSTTREDMKYSDIMTLEIDSEDNIWISYNRDNELAKFDKVKFEEFSIKNEIYAHGVVKRILFDSKNNPWFETVYYYTYYDGSKWESIKPGHFKLPELGQSRGMALDRDDILWFATTNDSVYYYKNDSVYNLDLSNVNITENKSLAHLYIDKKNNLYFSNNFPYIDENQSSRDELFQYNIDTQEWKKFDTTNSPMKQFITKIAEDVNGHIWVLTNRQIYKYDFVEWHNYDFEDYIMYHPDIGPSEGFSYLDIVFDQYNHAWISAAGAGVLELTGVISSVEDEEPNTQIKLYPNPADNFLRIEHNQTEQFTKYVIIDLNGKRMLSGQFNSTEIDISNLASGVYVIKLFGLHGHQAEKKFVVE